MKGMSVKKVGISRVNGSQNGDRLRPAKNAGK